MSQQQFIPTPKFEEYKERFKDFYKMQRRVDGVIPLKRTPMAGRSSYRESQVGWADAQDRRC